MANSTNLANMANCDDISPKGEIQLNEFKRRVPTEWRIQRIQIVESTIMAGFHVLSFFALTWQFDSHVC